jgi:uncharacterized membrane protein YqgA involved in biofilm formation
VFRGFGTVLNVTTVLVGSGIGVLVGHRLHQRTRDVVTDALGLVTLLVAALSATAVTDEHLSAAVGDGAPVLIVLGALVIGGIAGTVQPQPTSSNASSRAFSPRRWSSAWDRSRFWARCRTALVGALTSWCSSRCSTGSPRSLSPPASVGGVAASALAVLAVQGSLTLLGVLLGSFVPEAHLVAMTATGGLLLVGVALRLLQIRRLPVADLLPALLVAPVLVQIVISV